MSAADPQFMYMILILPSLFGLTLIGDGLNKVLHEEQRGFLSIFFWRFVCWNCRFCLLFLFQLHDQVNLRR